jgi:hypothetical protein
MLNTVLAGEIDLKDPKTKEVTTLPALGPSIILTCPGRLAEMLWDADALHRLQRGVAHEFAHQIDGLSAFSGYDMVQKARVSENFQSAYADLRACLKSKYTDTFKDPGNPDASSFLKNTLGRDPEGVDFYLAEITADLWASSVAPKLLKTPTALLSSLTHYCGDNDLNGSHPPGNFRIKHALADPAARELLGCVTPPENVCL